MKRPKGKELWIGATSNVVGQGAATNDFTVVDEEAYGALSVAYLEKIVDSIGQANSGTEASKSADWSGCIATFTAIPPLTFTLPLRVKMDR